MEQVEHLIKLQEESHREIQELKRLVTDMERPLYLDLVAEQLSNIVLAPIEQMFQAETEEFHIAVLPALPYNSSAAFAYATKYCGQNANSCGTFYPSDCTHFMSHCLAAGGVGVVGGDPKARCPAGLCIRAEELAAAFYNATKKFSNVKQISSYDLGRRGDYGFLRRIIEKSHAFLLNGTPSATSGPVYAHTNNHCGDAMDTIRIYFGAYYRIE